MTHTEQFDAAMGTVTQERGTIYGHPLAVFGRISFFKRAIADCPDDEIRHALEMIAVKIARLIETPEHLDSAVDIAGYARTICMIVDERKERRGQ